MPEAVISPAASSCLHRSLLSSVQWLPFRLGDSRCANRPSGSFLRVESIQPKHKASSTMSMYGSASGRGVFDLLQATQQLFAVRWLRSSHSLSCCLLVNIRRLVTSITILFRISWAACSPRGRMNEHSVLSLSHRSYIVCYFYEFVYAVNDIVGTSLLKLHPLSVAVCHSASLCSGI